MGGNGNYSLARLDSNSDGSISTNKDDSVRSGCAIEMGKELDNNTNNNNGSPFPFIIRTQSRDDDGHLRRTGNVWTATAHVITAVIGSGVLSLAWSMAQIGWLVGPPILVLFAIITWYMALLLADCYRHPDPTTGIFRNYTYMDAVRAYSGGKDVWFCGIVQYLMLVGTSIGYTITASISMVAIERSDCFYKNGHDHDKCTPSNNTYMIIFGAIQILLSQIPDFNRLWWLSIVAAVMSFSYSSIGLGLSISKSIEGGHSHGSLFGASSVSKEMKVWSVCQALGNIAFAYSFMMILIEIQDTLRSPPPENKTMKRASSLGIFITTIYYVSVGCMGYIAFGDAAPGNLLTGFGFYNPYWLVDFANACIAVHLVGAYQVFAQPIFAFVEDLALSKWPSNSILNHEHTIPSPFKLPIRVSLFRILWRSLFVVVTTIVSMVLPFFNDILGLLGAIAFWPLTVYFPLSMYISQTELKPWTKKWVLLQTVSLVCLLVSLAAAVGSVAGIVDDLKLYTPFKTHY